MNHYRDFSKRTKSQLDKKGISIVGSVAIPDHFHSDFNPDKYFQGIGYNLVYNDTGFIRTHSQVIVLAQSSWNPETDIL